MPNRWRVTIVAALVLFFTLCLTGCEGGRKCLDYDTQVVTTTTIVNGKVVPGTSVITTCVEYEEPKATRREAQ